MGSWLGWICILQTDTSFFFVIWSQESPPPQFRCRSVYGIWDQCSTGPTRGTATGCQSVYITGWFELAVMGDGMEKGNRAAPARVEGLINSRTSLTSPSHISHFLNLTSSSVTSSEAKWPWAWYAQTNTQAIWWEVQREPLTKCGQEKKNKCRPDLLLPIFSVLLGKKWDSTRPLA